MMERISEVWCKTMHRSAMWPIHGKYICSECLREHPVRWAEPAVYAPDAQPQNGHELSISSTTATALR
jgi:acetone carboxylase gamma subunit